MKMLNSGSCPPAAFEGKAGSLPELELDGAIRARHVRLRCEVTREDIDAMREAYDSGMSDWTTANAISRAVARLVGLDASQRLVRLKRRTAGDDGATVVIDGVIELRVPGEAIKKLWSVETGGSSEPFAFLLDLPREERRPAAAILRQSAVPWSQLMRCINSVFL